jgi:hypothetical protein
LKTNNQNIIRPRNQDKQKNESKMQTINTIENEATEFNLPLQELANLLLPPQTSGATFILLFSRVKPFI